MHWPTLAFWLGIPALLLIFFSLFKPKLAPLALLICPIVDLLVYNESFFYYESQGLLLLFTAVQLILTAIPAALICLKPRKG